MAHHHRRFMIFSAALAAVAATLHDLAVAVADAVRDGIDLILEALRDDFRYQPNAAVSIDLDRLAANIEPTPSTWRSFRAFLARALTHERYTGDGFAYDGGSTA